MQIFGGDDALERRKKNRKKDPKASASPMSGNAVQMYPNLNLAIQANIEVRDAPEFDSVDE